MYLKCGHLANQDTFGCPKGVRNRDVPLYPMSVETVLSFVVLYEFIHVLQVEYLKTLAGKTDLSDVSSSLASIATDVFSSRKFK